MKKLDYEYSPEVLKSRPFELWANVDSIGRKLIYIDTDYKISVDSYSNPKVLRLYTTASIGEKKIGELICTRKEYLGKKYIVLKNIDIEDLHKGYGYSFKMSNCLLSILDKRIEGVITPYKKRIKPEAIKKLFFNLGGFINDFGYLEIKNPKNNIL